MNEAWSQVAVIIPCFREKKMILEVISRTLEYPVQIYVIDDSCPESTGDFVLSNCNSERVKVIKHAKNKGVGGAVKTGYQAALIDGYQVLIKIDGDLQMDPNFLPKFIDPIIRGDADYTKGNRFYYLDGLLRMPRIRLIGNIMLSFLTKASSGYWNIFDPTNGYTGLHAALLTPIQISKVDDGFFFESDMLFRLNIARAKVIDIPIPIAYGNEKSSLSIKRIFMPFIFKNLRNFVKRIFYTYLIRNFSVATIELMLGFFMVCFGLYFGVTTWIESAESGQLASTGSIMLSALPIIIGSQMLFSFLTYDLSNEPKNSVHNNIHSWNNN